MKRSSTVLSLAVMASLIGGAVQAGPSRHETRDDNRSRSETRQDDRSDQRRGQKTSQQSSKSRNITVNKVTVNKVQVNKTNRGHSAKRVQRHKVGHKLARNNVVVVNNYHAHGLRAPGRDRVYVQQGDAIYLAAAATLAILAVMN
ncbi:RcnB family protein [Roseovarius sp. C7]|uniref:RcnB family protein n=1 Tax=Roseovarius sp. C7 TaxID=3398643 RepID=UPI0039F4D3EA